MNVRKHSFHEFKINTVQTEMLQNMGENGFEMLTELFNKIWEKERIPKDWEV